MGKQHRLSQRLAAMRVGAWAVGVCAMACVVAGCATGDSSYESGADSTPAAAEIGHVKHRPSTARFAAFNTALSRPTTGELAAAMAGGGDRKAAQVAEILQRVRPDVVLLSEVDRDATGKLIDDFRKNYLGVSQNGADPIDYPFAYAPPVNTGEPSGADLDQNGNVGGPGDAYGWGNYPGHFGLLLLSRFPLGTGEAKTFREMRWADLPSHAMPAGWYKPAAAKAVRLSSKTHAVVPVTLPNDRGVVLMLSHPTPPVFDGPEDRNGRRNHDEVRFWVDFLDGKTFKTDQGTESHLLEDDAFVILGDLNADPHDGDSFGNAMRRLIDHPRVHPGFTPTSRGGVEAAATQAGLNAGHGGDPAHDTGDFADTAPRGPGNLRIDYVLPSASLKVTAAGMFWPATDEPHADLVKVSDHRLVWVDLQILPSDDAETRRSPKSKSSLGYRK